MVIRTFSVWLISSVRCCDRTLHKEKNMKRKRKIVVFFLFFTNQDVIPRTIPYGHTDEETQFCMDGIVYFAFLDMKDEKDRWVRIEFTK